MNSSWLAHLDNPPVVSQRKPCLECARGWGSQLPWTSWKVSDHHHLPWHHHRHHTPIAAVTTRQAARNDPLDQILAGKTQDHEGGPSVTNWQSVICCQSGSIWSPLPPSTDRVCLPQSPSCTITFTLSWRQGRYHMVEGRMGYESSSVSTGRMQRPSTDASGDTGLWSIL